MFAYSIYGIFLKGYSRRGRRCTDKFTFSYPMKIRKAIGVLAFPFSTPKSCIVTQNLNRWEVIDNFGRWFLFRIWWWILAVNILKSSGDLVSQSSTRYGLVWRFGISLLSWLVTGWLRGIRHRLSGTLWNFGARSHTALSVRWTHAFARYVGVESNMMLKRVRTKVIQDRPQRSRLGGKGFWISLWMMDL